MPANLTEFRDSSGVDVSDKFVSLNELSDLHNAGYMTNDGDSFYNVQNDTLWTWGFNNHGQLGLGDGTDRSSPVQVGSLANWSLAVGGQYHTAAIKKDGSLWTWGQGSQGQTGLGNQTEYSSPVQVGSLTDWVNIESGVYHLFSVKTDGTLWTWGQAGFNIGCLGLGDTTNRSSPTQVGSLTDWKQASAGHYTSAAVKTDGTLWAWGYNYFGHLGLGDRTNRSSPVQVGSLTNWRSITLSYDGYTSFAIKTDGTLWAWGNNDQGQLGLGDTNHRSSPVQVGSLTNWKQISASYTWTNAIKTDGTLWAWGNGSSGELGLNDTSKRSSPVQVGSLTNWKQVSNNGTSTSAIKTDGTLWAWGQNNHGSLGLNNLWTYRCSSPIQVGSLNVWKNIGCGAGNFKAIK